MAGFNIKRPVMPAPPEYPEVLGPGEPIAPPAWQMPTFDPSPSTEALTAQQAMTANQAATTSAVGSGIQTVGNTVDPKHHGTGSILGSAAGMAGTGAILGSAVPGIGTAAGAVVGGTIGLGLGIIGAKNTSRDERDARQKAALGAAAQDTANAGAILKQTKLRLGSGRGGF